MLPASGCGDISLKTSSSSFRVRVPEGLGYNFTARASFGRISSELPVTSTGSIGGDTMNGTIGPGGCPLQLTDSNGTIEMPKAPRCYAASLGGLSRLLHCKRFVQDAGCGFCDAK